MREVASATGTQSEDKDEVSAAVARLDDMTQRNAALVEQSAAAAQALEHQAVQLEELVGVFRGAPAPGHQAAAPRESAALEYRSNRPLALRPRKSSSCPVAL